jgi:hypothetical protein
MAISNLDTLHEAIREWASRPELAARTYDFIRMAEDRLNSELELRVQEVDLAMTCAAGSRNPVTFPADYVQPYALFLTTFQDESELTPYLAGEAAISSSPSTPSAWTINGEAVELDCPCERDHTFKFRYRKALRLVPPFEGGPDEGDTNWLLQNHPSIYLFASLVELATFMRDGDLAQGYEVRLRPLLSELKTKEGRARAQAITPLRFDPPLAAGARYNIYVG